VNGKFHGKRIGQLCRLKDTLEITYGPMKWNQLEMINLSIRRNIQSFFQFPCFGAGRHFLQLRLKDPYFEGETESPVVHKQSQR